MLEAGLERVVEPGHRRQPAFFSCSAGTAIGCSWRPSGRAGTGRTGQPARQSRRSGELMGRPVALGFRVKSGFAVAVVVSGSAASPVALARRIVALSDPGVEETKQPYHDGFGTAQEDRKEIARLTKIIQRCASRSIADLLADDVFDDGSCLGAGLVVGSVIDFGGGRKDARCAGAEDARPVRRADQENGGGTGLRVSGALAGRGEGRRNGRVDGVESLRTWAGGARI